MKILDIVENDDGSARLTIDFTREEENMLIQYAFVDILKKTIEKEKPQILDNGI